MADEMLPVIGIENTDFILLYKTMALNRSLSYTCLHEHTPLVPVEKLSRGDRMLWKMTKRNGLFLKRLSLSDFYCVL